MTRVADWRERLAERLLAERRGIEKILDEVRASGEPVSLLEQARIDEHIEKISELSSLLEGARQSNTKSVKEKNHGTV
ncbi:MAG: hypothetical protein LJE84_05670 [Gammaproteobacteria bacterium]|nr:hypothetical protein [Gammaproteobacteria bacterium]